ncbi:hypothetical protein JCM4914_67280 [Streptomyces platensis subsp. malvinus]
MASGTGEGEPSPTPDKRATEEAKETLESDTKWHSQGPRTKRSHSPKGERHQRND